MVRKLTANDNQERSKPHRRVESYLDESGISYLSEQEFSPYTVDIYLPEWHLGIEVDGPFHTKTKDKIRDQWLEERYGLLLIRLDMKFWRSKQYINDNILAFIEKYADTCIDRKSQWRLTAH